VLCCVLRYIGKGVFSNHTLAPIRMVPVFEGSLDDNTWHEYGYRYQMSHPTSSPCHIAPWHPRLDHLIFYIPFGALTDEWLSNAFVSNPYRQSHNRSSLVARIAQRLMDPLSDVTSLFISPFGYDQRPNSIRVRLMSLVQEGTQVDDRNATPLPPLMGVYSGKKIWWRREYVSMYLAPTRMDMSVWRHWCYGVELWPWESQVWFDRSSAYKRLMTPAHQAVRILQQREDHTLHSGEATAGATPLSSSLSLSALVAAHVGNGNGQSINGADAVAAFWDAIKLINDECTDANRWSSMPSLSARLSLQYAPAKWDAMLRVLAIMSHYLAARLEPHMPRTKYGARSKGLPREPVIRVGEYGNDNKKERNPVMLNTRWCVLMFCHHIILYGRESTEEVWIRSSMIPSLVSSLTQSRGLYVMALFHWDTFVMMARQRRVTRTIFGRRSGVFGIFPGLLLHMEVLAAQPLTMDTEYLPIMIPPTVDQDWKIVTQATPHYKPADMLADAFN
jgi:hypothetical protein